MLYFNKCTDTACISIVFWTGSVRNPRSASKRTLVQYKIELVDDFYSLLSS